MYKKRVKRLIPLLAVLTLLTGCWDARDIDGYNIATLIMLDYQDGQAGFFCEIANVSGGSGEGEQGGGGGDEKSTFVTAMGANFVDARNRLDQQLCKPINLSAVRTLIITQRACETELAEYLFRLRADPTYRQKVQLVTTRTEPLELMEAEPVGQDYLGFSIDSLISTLVENGQSFHRTTARYVENLLTDSAFVIPCVDLTEEERIALSGYTVICNASSIGFIPVEESRGLVYIKGDNPRWTYRIPYDAEKNVTLDVRMNKKSVKSYADGDSARFELHFKFTADVLYFSGLNPMPLTDEAEEIIQATIKAQLEQDLTDAILRSQQEFRCDYLALDDEFRIAHPAEFRNMDWNARYPDMPVTLSVEVVLDASGILDYSPKGVER